MVFFVLKGAPFYLSKSLLSNLLLFCKLIIVNCPNVIKTFFILLIKLLFYWPRVDEGLDKKHRDKLYGSSFFFL